MFTSKTTVKSNPFYFVKSSLAVAVFCALIAPTSQSAFATKPVVNPLNNNQQLITTSRILRPKIQLAILLDTSNSMDGLIDQTRNQLWQVVNEFSTANKNGMTPILEVALFEYGNDANPRSQGYIRKLNHFTRELDKVSEGLFSLTTNGGNEFCGFAIKTAVNSLQWSKSDDDIKTIFIAGNEPFTQGPVNYADALKLANQYGISVNTIHAGDHQAGIQSGWQSGALLAGGDYMSIDSNQKIVHIQAPQDKKIAELNAKLNQTYIPYGKEGRLKKQRQMEQDVQSNKISAGLMAKRAKAKSTSFYNNSMWDLVDAMEEGEIDSDKLVSMKDSALPEPMRGMSAKEKKDYVLGKAEQRTKLKQEILSLSRSRDKFVAEAKREKVAAAPSMSDALTKAIKKQAKDKSFKFVAEE